MTSDCNIFSDLGFSHVVAILCQGDNGDQVQFCNTGILHLVDYCTVLPHHSPLQVADQPEFLNQI